MGEDTITSLKREFEEELGVGVTVVGLKAVAENFFEFNDKKYHELQYLYIVKLNDLAIEKNNGRFYAVEEKDVFEWKSIKDIDSINYRPNILKEPIKEVLGGDFSIRHYIHKGNG
jgi:8-oxo-dGTP pyrophosphatase MutT (NUDIX family)